MIRTFKIVDDITLDKAMKSIAENYQRNEQMMTLKDENDDPDTSEECEW